MGKCHSGNLQFRITEFAKRVAFRSTLLSFISRPRYQYGIQPAQLAWLVNKIDETRFDNKTPGVIVEVGVARGMTSVFLLEHMRCTGETRRYYCIDTFAGFLEKDILTEVNNRGKHRSEMAGFTYNSRDAFENNLEKAGYCNFNVICADAAAVDYASIGPIDVMLLDVDLYAPTKAVLNSAWKYLNCRAYVMVDDCVPNNSWDGADQAYGEFTRLHGLPRVIVGNRGGILGKGGGKSPFAETCS